MAEMLKTRAGLEPSAEELPYKVTTQQIEKYFQNKFDVVNRKMNERLKAEGKEPLSPITIRILAIKISDRYCPLFAIMSENVIAKQEKAKNVNPIFVGDEGDHKELLLRPDAWNILKTFVENKRHFEDPNWTGRMDIKRRNALRLRKLCHPSITRSNGNRNKCVVLLLDPISVIYDMLKLVNDNTDNFHVDIEKFKKMRDDQYTYFVYRVRTPGHNNVNVDKEIVSILNKELNGSFG